MIRALGSACILLIALTAAACGREREPGAEGTPVSPSPGGSAAKRVVIVTHTEGFRHSSNEVAEATIAMVGQRSGLFAPTFCRTADEVARVLTPAGLAGIDAVVFANTSGSLPIPDLGAFLGWIRDGHGFAGMHSATDTYHDQPAYLEMIGNEFSHHGEQAAVDAVVENRAHPAASPLGERFRTVDEIYKFRVQNRGVVTMLLSLDRHPLDGLPEAGQAADLPLAWAKDYGRGRVFYTALGHREDVWQHPSYQEHVLGGLRWVLGS